jgi:hypothetical protein
MKIIYPIVFTLCFAAIANATPTLGGPVAPDGKTEVAVDLPTTLRAFNTGGKDGAGLCVFTSIMHSARWQSEVSLTDFQTLMKAEKGGGWPQKVDAMIAKYAPGTKYVQITNGDAEFLKLALKTGRLPAVTYDGHDPHYSGKIAHMVNLVYLDDRYACVLDNNFVTDKAGIDNQLVWMTPAEFMSRWKGNGGGWAVVLLAPPPAPVPHAGQLPDRSAWSAPVYEWRNYPENVNQVFLCRGEATLGGWDYPGEYWRPYVAGKWGPIGEPPFSPPEWSEVFAAGRIAVTNYGVGAVSGPAYSLNGRAASRETVFAAVEQCPGPGPCPAPKPIPAPSPAPMPLPDDSALLRLTVIGDTTGKVVSDLNTAAELSAWRGKLLVQSYPLGHALISGVGFPSGFQIVIQSPSGKVLHRQSSYTGPAQLATALRKSDPNYDPSKDPDLTKPAPTPAPSPLAATNLPGWAVVPPLAAVGVAAALLLPYVGRRRSVSTPSKEKSPWQRS